MSISLTAQQESYYNKKCPQDCKLIQSNTEQ